VTDAHFPERWLNDRRILRLPPEAFRFFVLSLTWSLANRTDGVIYDDDLALIPGSDPGAVDVLAKADLWKRTADYWLITVYAGTQTTAEKLEQLDANRAAEAASKKRRRHHRGGDHRFCSPDDCGMSGGTSGGTSGRSPTGQDRTVQVVSSTGNNLKDPYEGKINPSHARAYARGGPRLAGALCAGSAS
jgi:hypothetical protein